MTFEFELNKFEEEGTKVLPDRKEFKLYNNYPNPFNPSTKIKFDIAQGKGQSSHVKLIVYDILGRAVASLMDGNMIPGSYEVDFKGENFASGIYFYKLETESYVDTKKMLMIK